MSDEPKITDVSWLNSLMRDSGKHRKKHHEFREPQANTRRDKKRLVGLSLDESEFQYVVDSAREKNVSINHAIALLIKEIASKNKSNN
jgi:hypothetical protein